MQIHIKDISVISVVIAFFIALPALSPAFGQGKALATAKEAAPGLNVPAIPEPALVPAGVKSERAMAPEWIFDQIGHPILILDGDCLRNGYGNVVGWIVNENVWSLYGRHAGWFENGAFFDSQNRLLGFLKGSTDNSMTHPGVLGTPGMPGFFPKPGRPGLATPPTRPGRIGSWSSEDLETYFERT